MGRRKGTIDPEREKYWREIFKRFHKSGETFRKFCENEKISPNTFQFWRRELRLRDEQRGKVSAIRPGENKPSDLREKLEYWRMVLQEIQAYPGSLNSFCKNHGISSGNLHYWRKRLEELESAKESGKGGRVADDFDVLRLKGRIAASNTATSEAAPHLLSKESKRNFVALQVVNDVASSKAEARKPADFIELVVQGGSSVRITHDSDFTLLSRLLSFMEDR